MKNRNDEQTEVVGNYHKENYDEETGDVSGTLNSLVGLPNGKPSDPIKMLQEIEAYLTFRLITDEPTVPPNDMRQMKTDIGECLRRNGVEVNWQPNDQDQRLVKPKGQK